MKRYRVYRVGEDDPVRTSGDEVRLPKPAESVNLAPSQRWSRPWVWAGRFAAVTALAVVCVLGWLYGKDLVATSTAALDLAQLTGKVPTWALYGAPAAALGIIGLASAYLAFGRHIGIKLVGVAIVVAALAAPGLALGWANGTVSTVGNRSAEVEQAVTKTEKKLRPSLPGEAVNILLIGRDEATPGDPGRSDTQILVRLDPATKSISMLSIPRDLRVEVPGYGVTKMNAAYSYGGPALVVETFSHLTGLPINHFVEVDFGGFWHAVNILGGVYIPVDRRYYNPEESAYKSIDIEPGYQLMRGHDALDFVRFRHDETGDFGRMQRQQLFLREAQRQSSRWSDDWTKVARLIKAITAETTSDINSLQRLKPLVELVFQVDTSQVYTTHIEGATPTIDGVSYVTPTQEEIDSAVDEFMHPTRAPVQRGSQQITKKMYTVTVCNASGIPGLTDTVEDQLTAQGYTVARGPDTPEFPSAVTAVYATSDLATQARAIAALFDPSRVTIIKRAPGVDGGVRVFVASSFTGGLTLPEAPQEPQQTLLAGQNVAADSWRALAAKSPLKLEMPTAWVAGSAYDEFRAYSLADTDGRRSAAAVAVARTPSGGYWSIQTMRWLNPPAIANPSGTQTLGGTDFLLFHQGTRLHMVAWKRNKTLYWILNSIDNELSNETMLGLARSFKPVQ